MTEAGKVPVPGPPGQRTRRVIEPELRLGATWLGRGEGRFLVWAPEAELVEVCLVRPPKRLVPLRKEANGYHQAVVKGVAPGDLYLLCLDGEKERPDPASRFQPQGVHGPSQVLDQGFDWRDQGWAGLDLEDYLIYELHPGTFTPEGTLEAIIPRLDYLKELGVTVLELMPLAQFPGQRNWGYDGVFPFAVHNSYGGPEGLKKLVNACHASGLAVILDVVYNHLGPEGNYLADFGPFFSHLHQTPWGRSINFDGPGSDQVRRFFIENACYWIEDLHLDGLRLDAVQAILDFSARPFLEELAETVRTKAGELKRKVHLIAESSLNDPRLIRTPDLGGHGLSGLWNDDFHHALHALLTRERVGYYQDFGRMKHLAKAYEDGFVYTGQYSSFYERRQGRPCPDLPPGRLVVFAQNHDQVGNRPAGRRLDRLTGLEGLKLAGAAIILSPFIPLLFMGQEYGEKAPFPFFINHSEPDLVEAVRQGRRRELADFGWSDEPPDPQAEETFLSARLDWDLIRARPHQSLFRFHKELIRLRKAFPCLALGGPEALLETTRDGPVLTIRRKAGDDDALILLNFSPKPAPVAIRPDRGRWSKLLDSAEEVWEGSGAILPARLDLPQPTGLNMPGFSAAVYKQEKDQTRDG